MASSLGQGEVENEEGIVQGHTYTVLSVHEFKYKGAYVKLIKLRNPWGHGEWKGAWSDTDEIWTDELKMMLGH